MVRHISNRIAVMYLGVIVELANRDELYLKPLHPYIARCYLLCPSRPDCGCERERVILTGDVPLP